MQVPYLSALLKMDMYTTRNLNVPPHELALLSTIYGGENVTDVKPNGFKRDLDAQEEYTRLKRMYGVDQETKRPWVDITFGRFEEGRFEKTMKDGTKHYSPKATRKTRAKKVKVNVEDPVPA